MPIRYSIDGINRRLLTHADGLVPFHDINAHRDHEQRNRDLDRPELIGRAWSDDQSHRRSGTAAGQGRGGHAAGRGSRVDGHRDDERRGVRNGADVFGAR